MKAINANESHHIRNQFLLSLNYSKVSAVVIIWKMMYHLFFTERLSSYNKLPTRTIYKEWK